MVILFRLPADSNLMDAAEYICSKVFIPYGLM